MNFKRARSEKQKQIRVNQIINAALKLYDKMPYEEITLAGISKELDFTRANIYKYVSSKEEIFLKITEQELKSWIEDFRKRINKKDNLSTKEFANLWAKTLYKHKRLIKLLSILYTIIEKNVTVDNLAEFKTDLFENLSKIHTIIKNQFQNMTMENINTFINMQMYFAIGLFPATKENEIQRKAIKKSGVPYNIPDFVDVFSDFIVMIFNGLL